NGGHNGLRSLDAEIGPDYRPAPLGIGHPGDKDLGLPPVLGDFTPPERVWLAPLLAHLAAAAPPPVPAHPPAPPNKVAVLTAPAKAAPADPDSTPPETGHA